MMIQNFYLSTTASLKILNMNVKVIEFLLTSNLQFSNFGSNLIWCDMIYTPKIVNKSNEIVLGYFESV